MVLCLVSHTVAQSQTEIVTHTDRVLHWSKRAPEYCTAEREHTKLLFLEMYPHMH